MNNIIEDEDLTIEEVVEKIEKVDTKVKFQAFSARQILHQGGRWQGG